MKFTECVLSAPVKKNMLVYLYKSGIFTAYMELIRGEGYDYWKLVKSSFIEQKQYQIYWKFSFPFRWWRLFCSFWAKIYLGYCMIRLLYHHICKYFWISILTKAVFLLTMVASRFLDEKMTFLLKTSSPWIIITVMMWFYKLIINFSYFCHIT